MEKQKFDPFTITISLHEDGGFEVSPSRNMSPAEALGASMNLCSAVLNSTMRQAEKTGIKPEELQELKGNLYDNVNIMASSLLHDFAPEIDMRPDLTVDAIKAKEDEIYDKAVKDGKIVQMPKPKKF